MNEYQTTNCFYLKQFYNLRTRKGIAELSLKPKFGHSLVVPFRAAGFKLSGLENFDFFT